ncbi:hypothetical protein [Halomicrobium salinisoli]|uniref:hypothetical protein n=1 Tax=Halomicrobium salinisoli TaxID=2878391 RepID=UPI001CF09B37|nr:hypothetical protein [Halomicrobium salinisoli]
MLSGTAAAHFSDRLDVDVAPGSEDGVVDIEEDETVPVAVSPVGFTTEDGERVTFDPTERPVRYRFGSRDALGDGGGARPVDDGEVIETGDGREALLLEFPVEASGLEADDNTARLYWERDESGNHGYSGSDSVTVVGPVPSEGELVGLFRQLLIDFLGGAR